MSMFEDIPVDVGVIYEGERKSNSVDHQSKRNLNGPKLNPLTKLKMEK
jgi:hypothetical protein